MGIEVLEARRLLSIAMVTWGGDANLDGKINIDDYGRIDGNVDRSDTISGWFSGDFNYDGDIIIDDFLRRTFEVAGTAGDDRITVFVADLKIQVDVNGKVATYEVTSDFRIDGRRGNDVIIIADDVPSFVLTTIFGGAGDDTIVGGVGLDRVLAGTGDDVVIGGDGRDTIYGEEGDDSIRGAGGSDLLDGGDGYDTLRGDAGNDNLSGGANPDRLRGSAGNDLLNGGGGRDHLAGEAGDDALFGGVGADVLHGGGGIDSLLGGADHDTIYFSSADGDLLDPDELSAGEIVE